MQEREPTTPARRPGPPGHVGPPPQTPGAAAGTPAGVGGLRHGPVPVPAHRKRAWEAACGGPGGRPHPESPTPLRNHHNHHSGNTHTQAAEARMDEDGEGEGKDGQGVGFGEQRPPPLARRGPAVHGRGAEAPHRVAFEHVGGHGGGAGVAEDEDEESNDDDDFVEIVEVPAGGRRLQQRQQQGRKGGQGAQEGADGGRRVRRRLDPDLQQVAEEQHPHALGHHTAGSGPASPAGPRAGPAPPRHTASNFQPSPGPAPAAREAIAHGPVGKEPARGRVAGAAAAAVAAAAPSAGSASGPYPAGHLHRIQLQNFMCHENLELRFGPHVTIINGRNGSGKSAVLQGLQVCLGASARDTGRGSSQGLWVMTGKRTATITLEIWNTGRLTAEENNDGEDEDDDDGLQQKWPPYRKHLYGDRIIIVRKICNDPVSASYHLYSSGSGAAGRGRELKRDQLGRTAAEEVAAIAEHFDVDTANPLIVITQDMVREFHKKQSGRRCSLYDMFMRGTCLARTRDTLGEVQARVVAAARVLAEAGERLAGARQRVAELTRQHEALRRVDELRSVRNDLELGIGWRVVLEAEAALRAAKRGLAQGPAAVMAARGRLQAARDEVERLAARETAWREEMQQTQAHALAERVTEARARQRAAVADGRRLRRAAELARAELAGLAADREQLREVLRVQQEEQSSGAAVTKMHEYEEKVARATERLTELQARERQLDEERRRLDEQIRAAEPAAAAAREALRDARHELSATQRDLAEVTVAGGAAIQLWGREAMALRQNLDQALQRPDRGGFSAPPIGPVGMYLRRVPGVGDGEARVLEAALGGVMDAWVVNTRADMERLWDMANRVGGGGRARRGTWPPRVFISAFRSQVYDYGPQRAVDGQRRVWRRLIDMVRVEGLDQQAAATVLNTLLDRAAAAATAVVHSREDGQAVGLGQVAALGIGTAYDVKGWYGSSNGTMSTAWMGLPRDVRVGADTQQRREQLVAAVVARQQEVAAAEAAEAAAVQALEALRRQRQGLVAREREVKRQAASTSTQLETLRAEPPSAAAESATQELMNAIAEAGSAMAAASSGLQALEEQANDAAARATQAEAEARQLAAQSQTYLERRQELLQHIEALGADKARAAAAVAAAQNQVSQEEAAVAAAEARVAAAEAKLEDVRGQVAEVCSREEGLEALERLVEAKARDLAAAGTGTGAGGQGRGAHGAQGHSHGHATCGRRAVASQQGALLDSHGNAGAGAGAEAQGAGVRAGDGSGAGPSGAHGGGEVAVARAAAVEERTEQLREQARAALTSQELRQWHKSVDTCIKSAEQQAEGDLETVTQKLNDAQAKLSRRQEAVTVAKKKVQSTEQAYIMRSNKYHRMRGLVGRYADEKFRAYMKRRDMHGKMDLDHKQEVLALTVTKGGEEQPAGSLLTLSGGERSFTTSSLLLAVGEVLDAPFRIMDEYDVYMDDAARRMVTVGLVEYAWMVNRSSQMVLLSPQDMGILGDVLADVDERCASRGLAPPPPHFVNLLQLADPREEGGAAAQ